MARDHVCPLWRKNSWTFFVDLILSGLRDFSGDEHVGDFALDVKEAGGSRKKDKTVWKRRKKLTWILNRSSAKHPLKWTTLGSYILWRKFSARLYIGKVLPNKWWFSKKLTQKKQQETGKGNHDFVKRLPDNVWLVCLDWMLCKEESGQHKGGKCESEGKRSQVEIRGIIDKKKNHFWWRSYKSQTWII